MRLFNKTLLVFTILALLTGGLVFVHTLTSTQQENLKQVTKELDAHQDKQEQLKQDLAVLTKTNKETETRIEKMRTDLKSTEGFIK